MDMDMDMDMEIIAGIDKIIEHFNAKYSSNNFLRKVFTTILEKIKNNENTPFNPHKVSSSLCISERTLYRRLNENKKTYLEVKDEIRKIYAFFLLSLKKYKINQVSKHLFFKSTSAFTQSFKRWHGYTPSQCAHTH